MLFCVVSSFQIRMLSFDFPDRNPADLRFLFLFENEFAGRPSHRNKSRSHKNSAILQNYFLMRFQFWQHLLQMIRIILQVCIGKQDR